MCLNGKKKAFQWQKKNKQRNGLPCVYKNRVYFGKPQTEKGVVSKIVANLLKNASDIIGI